MSALGDLLAVAKDATLEALEKRRPIAWVGPMAGGRNQPMHRWLAVPAANTDGLWQVHRITTSGRETFLREPTTIRKVPLLRRLQEGCAVLDPEPFIGLPLWGAEARLRMFQDHINDINDTMTRGR